MKERLNIRKNLSKTEDEIIESLYIVFDQIKEMVKNNYITPKQGIQHIDNLSRIIESTSNVIDELIREIEYAYTRTEEITKKYS